MDAVASNLFVGPLETVLESNSLTEREIATLVVLTHEVPDDQDLHDVEVKHVPMMDGPQNSQSAFCSAVAVVTTCLANNERVAVCCSAGTSRSPAVAATALARHNNKSLPDAFQQVANRRPVVSPHEALIEQAASVYSMAEL